MMATYLNTRDAAARLGISPSRLSRAVWERRIDPPMKSPSGGYLWTQEDIRRASWQLRGLPLEAGV